MDPPWYVVLTTLFLAPSHSTFLERKLLTEIVFLANLSYSMAIVAQLVRALDCGSKCRGFESRRSPIFSPYSYSYDSKSNET